MNIILAPKLRYIFFLGCVLSFCVAPDLIASTDQSPTFDRFVLSELDNGSNSVFRAELNDQEKILLDSARSFNYSEMSLVIFQEKGVYYFKPRCSLQLYQWSGSSWERFAGKPISGICGTYNFTLHGDIFGLGLSGYWQEQNDIFHFSPEGYVKFLPTANQPIDFHGSLKFTTQAGVFSLFGINRNERLGKNKLIRGGYFLEVETMTWKNTVIQLDEHFYSLMNAKFLDDKVVWGTFYETQDYAIIELGNIQDRKFVWMIVDKKTLAIYLYPLPNFFASLNWAKVNHNTLTLFVSRQSFPVEFHIDRLVASLSSVGNIQVLEDSFWDRIEEEYGLLLWGIPMCLMVFGLLWMGLNGKLIPKKTIPAPLQEAEEMPIPRITWTEKLKNHSGTTISQDLMDEILGIQEIKNPDARKAKRASSIRELNKAFEQSHGHLIIHRVREEQDKRIIQYRIAKFSKTDSAKNRNDKAKF